MNWHAGKVFRELRKLTFLFTAIGIYRRKQLVAPEIGGPVM
jgi:hypothetical protein